MKLVVYSELPFLLHTYPQQLYLLPLYPQLGLINLDQRQDRFHHKAFDLDLLGYRLGLKYLHRQLYHR
jgi:hypothetical protein